MTPEQLEKLVQTTLATRPEEIGCDTWLEQVGRYADLVVRGEPVPDDLSLVSHHLQVCAECAEEFELLQGALEDEDV